MTRSVSGKARVVGHRHPELLLAYVERDATRCGGPYRVDSGRHDTHYHVTETVQRNRFIDNLRVSTITALPESMPQNHHTVFSRLVLFGKERASDQRVYADHFKVSGADAGSHHL